MSEPMAQALAEVRERVAAAARRSGRPDDAVLVVGAVKGVDVARIELASELGLTDVGENTAKALRDKAATLGHRVRWHYLGAIQTNKVRFLDAADVLHGLDRAEEARALQARSDRTGKRWDVLIQVNVAGETSKQGIDPSAVDALLEQIEAYPAVIPRGFMFMAPQAQNPEDVRWTFAEGRGLRDRYSGSGLDELSMGMTDDFEVAIEEGATIVRIGRAIFARPHEVSTPRGK
jgi:pyridoxal phosphate enzyme (YggS family)